MPLPPSRIFSLTHTQQACRNISVNVLSIKWLSIHNQRGSPYNLYLTHPSPPHPRLLLCHTLRSLSRRPPETQSHRQKNLPKPVAHPQSIELVFRGTKIRRILFYLLRGFSLKSYCTWVANQNQNFSLLSKLSYKRERIYCMPRQEIVSTTKILDLFKCQDFP